VKLKRSHKYALDNLCILIRTPLIPKRKGAHSERPLYIQLILLVRDEQETELLEKKKLRFKTLF